MKEKENVRGGQLEQTSEIALSKCATFIFDSIDTLNLFHAQSISFTFAS
jgi:hypothetical protein